MDVALGIFALILLVWHVAHDRWLPPITMRRMAGRNGANNLYRVLVDPDARYPAAVAAQEVRELMHKRLIWNLFLVRFTDAGKRRLEILGHEHEVQMATLLHGVNSEDYRRAKAQAMQRGYDGIFKDMSVDGIVRKMRKHSISASRWVDKWADDIAELVLEAAE